MGQAKIKALREGEVLKFDFTAPDLHILKGDRVWLAKGVDGTVDESKIGERATRFVISNTIQAAYPNGMDRKDGKTWAAWLEALDEEAGSFAEVNRGMVEWLNKQMSNDATKVQPALAGWREAVVDYIEEVLNSPTE